MQQNSKLNGFKQEPFISLIILHVGWEILLIWDGQMVSTEHDYVLIVSWQNTLQCWPTLLLLLLSCFSRVQLCNPIDGSPPGSPVPGILQARTLEWVAMSFSNV